MDRLRVLLDVAHDRRAKAERERDEAIRGRDSELVALKRVATLAEQRGFDIATLLEAIAEVRRCVTAVCGHRALDEMVRRADEIAKRTGYTGGQTMGDGVSMIAAERERQTTTKGWTAAHDDTHVDGALAAAAAAYAYPADLTTRGRRRVHKRLLWPWSDGWRDHSGAAGRIRELAKAGALIAAEIDRLSRAAERSGGQDGE